ncbi:MAG: V-type ATP synthase subunit H [Candidatus Edwardsbacteria bacterium]|jgi:cell division septum initiation protein DivIVA|nr:V-type ATP synthase subunit H [Candidatus Edwardsbacteria bacterium]
MTHGHDGHRDQGLDIIEQLAERERELERTVEQAQAEARRIVEQAQADAARVEREAAEAERLLMAEHQQRLAGIAAEIGAARQAQARQEEQRLRAGAASRMDAAVAEVVNSVLPERS